MNPPFTKQERLPEKYKQVLIERFDQYKAFVHGQLGYYGYFVFLADKFLNENGKMALVLPASVLRLQSCEGIRKLWSERYVIDYLISSEYRSAFSESVSFREILLIARRVSKQEKSITKVATLKNLPKTLTESRDIAGCLREANDGYEDRIMSVKTVDYSELKADVSNWFKFIAVKDVRLAEFFQKLTSSGFVALSTVAELIRGYELMGGEANSLIINSREIRAIKSGDIWILSKGLGNKIVFHHKGMETRNFSVPVRATRRTLRRPSGVNKIDITEELDYVIVDVWDRHQFNKLRETTSHELPSTFIEKFKRDIEARMGNFFIVRRLNLAAPNTYALAFFSNIECAPTKLVWSAKVPKSKLMLIAAFFNSSINLLQTLLSRAETEGSFMDLSEYILLDFYVPDFETLSQKDGDTIIQAFEMMSKRPLSSLLDQIKQKDSDRFALDKAWLQALNYPGNIDKVLNWLYDALTDEIETLKTMMAEGHIEESTN